MKQLFTKAERIEAINMLKAAKMQIKNRYQIFLCPAITNSSVGTNTVKMKLRCEINVRIEKCAAVECWLNKKKGVPWRHLTNKNLREYRQRWIDSMIKELE